MIGAVLALTTLGTLAAPVRPALGSAQHGIARVPDSALASEILTPDGWQRRALVDRQTREIRVLGPERPAPTRERGAITIDAAQAMAIVAAMGWPGARDATLVMTRRGIPAWRIDPPASLRGPSNPVFLVDARDGHAWLRHDRVLNESVGAFRINPVLTPTAETFELIDFDPATPDGVLGGERIAVFNCVQPEGNALCGYEGITPSDASGDFLHPAPDITLDADNVQLEDAFAGQSVYHHADLFLAYLDALGVPPIGCLDQDMPVVLVSNYKAYLPDEVLLIGNASYVGDCRLLAAFGQGPQADYGYDGDVVYHELAHGVVELMMDGGLLARRLNRSEAVLRDAGAINEGTADFFAAVYTGNPTQAEYVALRTGEPARTADNALSCPNAITGEVHADGELWSGALWDAYAQIGDPLMPVLLDAISLLPEDATFEEASNTLVEVAAEELDQDAATVVQAAVADRGLLDCPRIIAWDEVERGIWLRPRGQGGKFRPLQPAPAQLAIALPADATGFWFRFQSEVRVTPGFSPLTELHALVSFGEPVAFEYSEDDDGFTNVLSDPDLHLPTIDVAAAAEGVWVEAPGGQTIYVSLFNQSANITVVSAFEVEVVFNGSSQDSTGGTDEGNADSTGA
ncbi:MAG: M36 family metallopeptidase, partial [Nannocystaceae bacterium]|nr:M36 family metallopeptidase [Nannocystaceae bacterium]